jgi:hypothetical protein
MNSKDFENSNVLILDSTGPGVTSHFSFLAKVGIERLEKFKAIHAFSGGIFAYLSYYAYQNGLLRHDVEEYVKNLDRRFIDFHHRGRKSPLGLFLKLLSGKPVFSWRALDRQIKYIFSPAFLERPISSLPENFVPYLAVENQCVGVDSSSAEWRSFRVYDLLLAGSSIPFVYETNALTQRYSDAVFSENFRLVFKKLVKTSTPTLVATMWPRRNTDTVRIHQTLASGSGRRRMYRDGFSILLGIPMHHWRREVKSLIQNPYARLAS